MIELKMDKEGKDGTMTATSTVTGKFDDLDAAAKFIKAEANKFMKSWPKATVTISLTLTK